MDLDNGLSPNWHQQTNNDISLSTFQGTELNEKIDQNQPVFIDEIAWKLSSSAILQPFCPG